jgi:hypothetical protein
VGSAADVSKVHATSLFMVKLCKVDEFVCIYTFLFINTNGTRAGDDAPFRPIRPVSRNISERKVAALLRVTECIKIH